MPDRRRARDAAGRTAPVTVPDEARAAATASRRAGATSSPNRAIVPASSLPRMNVEIPSSSTRGSRSSTQRSGGPCRKPAPENEPPPRFSRRRISRGSRPAAWADSSILAFACGQVAALQVAEARQPAVRLAPHEAEHPGLVGAEPDRDVMGRRRTALGAVHPVVRSRAPAEALARSCPRCRGSMSIASSSASTPCPGVRRAGSPSRRSRPRRPRTRAPARTDRPTAGRGSPPHVPGPPGGRSGRLSTFPATWMRSVDCGDPRQQRPRVEERRLVRVVLERHEVQPGALGRLRQRHGLVRVLGRRSQEGAEHQVVAVVRHRAPLD